MGDDTSFSTMQSDRDDQPWGDADADLPSAPALADALHRQLTDNGADEGAYERTASRRADGVDRYERSVVLVGSVHRSVIEIQLTESGHVMLSHRLSRTREGFLDRLRPGGPATRRGVDGATLDLLQSEQRSAIAAAVHGKIVRYKTTEKLAGFALAFETAKSAPPSLTVECTALADYLSAPLPALVSRIVSLERRSQC